MFRRLVVTATAIAAMLGIMLVVLPAGAITSQKADDLYAFAHDMAVTSPVAGNVQAYGGSVDVRDVVDGDLLVFGGNVSFSGRGRVNGNVIYAGGRIIDGEGRIGGDAYPLASVQGAAASMTKTAVVLSLLFVWLCVSVVVTLISPREVRLSSFEVRASALHCFVLGLVAFTSFALTAIMFSYLVPYLIGIPLLTALAVFAILTKIYGLVAVFHSIGTLVAGSRTREQLSSRKWLRGDVALVVVGVLLLGAIRLVPVLGAIVWASASVFGIGVALATKFGRREPWFLQFRSAVA